MKKEHLNINEGILSNNIIAPLCSLLEHKRTIKIKTLSGSLKSLSVSAIFENFNYPLFIICEDSNIAEDYFHDLKLLLNTDSISLLTEPKRHVKFDSENMDDRLMWIVEGLTSILKNDKSIIIATPEILNYELPIPSNISDNKVTLLKDSIVNFDEFIKNLLLNGFERRDFVSTQGDIAIRGGIVDIYPLGWDNPLRIEFFGNDVESIRSFDPLSQRSINKYDKVEFISKIFHSATEITKTTIFDYIQRDTIYLFDSQELFEIDEISKHIDDKNISILFNAFGEADINIKSASQPKFNSSIKNFCTELRKLAHNKYNFYICADGKIHLERIRDLVEGSLENMELGSTDDEAMLESPQNTIKSIKWLDNTLSKGFISEQLSLGFFTEHELFGRIRIQDSRKIRKKAGGLTLKELKELNIGDFVVHVDKGIGKFDGLETVTIGGNNQECVRLIFADGDILNVNLNYIHKVQKYAAEEGVQPKLSKLGSGEWERKKSKTKKKLKDIARELIMLYAKRKSIKGYSFPTDTLWQKEFEASFIYEDTPDQAKTTIEVKDDMISETPMDRLVCGDVGFGKTEIAIRAAFKAVQTGKQVAVLVPTTILAQQHYMTFKDRLNNYPVNTDVISRFRSPTEQKEIITRLKYGGIDILIGTHRLLSKDIQFKDLGLLIIDEEHRFGVGAKEKLRELRAHIDTLTLTATPIPRTLNFSLMGARDLSVIETPPRNRIPVFTEILEWNDKLVVKSINDEIKRGGQVFFVNDKIEDLERIRMNLQMSMPLIRFGLAHGQMKTQELEDTMEKFIEGKYDVLVTTKIVESGLDIPNANTIIINRSHKFGLAELYQLRGRVGRSNIQAFCYLIIPAIKSLSPISLRRLQAIEEFSDLGSGFQLAMRDLEIRGAGNMLGPEQSGYINEIGFELFHKILDEAVAELRYEEFGEVFKDKKANEEMKFFNEDIQIDIGSDALLPSDYVNSDTERFSYYKRLYNVCNVQELQEIIDEITDKFGKPPVQAKQLYFAVRLRIAVLNTGFTKVTLLKHKLVAEFPPETFTEFYEKAFPVIIDFIQIIENSQLVTNNKKLLLEVPINKKDEAIEIMWRIKKALQVHLNERDDD